MSNPTSNYGWQMPTATDLVSQLPADFEVFGQAVDTSLADLKGGTTGQILTKNTNTDMDFVWSTSSGMTNPMTTTGDTIYSSSGSTPARRAIGATGDVLTVSGGVPVWAAPGAGKVVQIVNVVYGTQVFSSSSTFADTGLTATITPTSASNKVLVIMSQNGMHKRNSNTAIDLRLLRNGSLIRNPGYFDGENDSSLRNQFGSVAMSFLDSPASTSAQTYKTTFNSTAGTNGVYVQFNGSESTITLMEVTP
jgi:hypothetical protein